MPMRFLILCLLMLCASCKSDAQPFVVYQQAAVMPQVTAGNASLAADFATQFEKITGRKPDVVQSASGESPIIELSLSKINGFSLTQTGNKLIISGANQNDIAAGMAYFLAEYAGRLVIDNHAAHAREIIIPKGLQCKQEYAFAYREPYFLDNLKEDFRKWNNTQTLDDNWALWGHNIGKKIKVTEPMLALVDGKHNEEQLCFSSPEMEAALTAFISDNENGAHRQKFMIMPNDNTLVCQCSSCKAKGNTKNNAGPAVFSLMNRLAKQFPEQEFFSTAYMTTEKAPKFSLEPNCGIMISTMSFQKGVVIEKSAIQGKVDKTFAEWKKVTDKIYLWDYAINFDNYFDAYPTLLIAQQNLKYYKNLGVQGVFMHGNEEGYSAFGDLKAYIYAQLLQNPDIDVQKHIKLFFENKYPAVSSLLFDYYIKIEQRALQSVKPLDIYGGISQSYKKYLDDAELKTFYEALADKAAMLDEKEQAMLNPLLASLAFQRLEVMRTNGFEANGYGDYNYDDGSVKIKPQVSQLLNAFEKYAKTAKLNVYNEQGFNIFDYYKLWENNIIKLGYKSLFYGKPIRSRFEPEEDYPNVQILNDGNIGFNDYYTNWFIATKNSIALEVNPKDVKESKVVEMSFLKDVRHKIFLPEKVTVKIDGRKYEASVSMNDRLDMRKVTVSIPIEIKRDDKLVIIEVTKYKEYKNKSVACDEVYFK